MKRYIPTSSARATHSLGQVRKYVNTFILNQGKNTVCAASRSIHKLHAIQIPDTILNPKASWINRVYMHTEFMAAT